MKHLPILLFHKLWNIKLRLLSLFSFKTLGVRALVIKGEQVLLVKHSYSKGWYTIGGGVEKGETPLEALKRELLEEVGVTLAQDPILMNIYYNNTNKREDYVIFYVAKHFSIRHTSSPEIAELSWFKLNDLPEDTSPATRRRIEEYLNNRVVSERW